MLHSCPACSGENIKGGGSKSIAAHMHSILQLSKDMGIYVHYDHDFCQ